MALVSVVIPAFNAGRYLDEAVRSVLAQTHTDWELLLVDDGSTDATAARMASFTDTRIRCFHQANKGVSEARNHALERAKGAFVCFLDADDVLPPTSLAARLAVFEEHPSAGMVDGSVIVMDHSMQRELRKWTPSFQGDPLGELVRLTGSCFFGPTWMIRWSPLERTRFAPGLTHAEDLLFFIMYAPGKEYRTTNEVILHYRHSTGSAMSDLKGLERSYHFLFNWMTEHAALIAPDERRHFRRKVRRIMVGSYWHARRPFSALRSLLR